jgi:Transposase
MCQNEVVEDLKRREPSVEQIIRIGMDTSKHVFQLHGVNAVEEPVLRKKLPRKAMVKFLEKLPASVIAIEACGGSHHWARLLQSFGHRVKLIPPQYVKPYVKRGKNDAADAEALCEAMSRPTMRFVPVKTAEQQGALMLVGVRDRLVRNRTQLTNAIRGYAAEFGLTAAKGMCRIAPLLERIAVDETLPAMARELFALHAKEYGQLQAQLGEIEAKLMAVASCRCMQPAPGPNPRHRPDRCGDAGYEDAGTRDIPIGAALRRLARLDAERSFDRGKGQARRHHARRRRGLAQRAGGRRHRRPLARPKQTRIWLAVARRVAQAQAAQARRRGPGQQERPYRLEANGQR